MRKLSVLFLLLIHTFCFAQIQSINHGNEEYRIAAQMDACLSATNRLSIQTRLTANASQLESEGRLLFPDDREDVLFSWPLQKASGFDWNDYYGISNFVDQDPTAGLLDYHCDARTYDGHFGTDIFTWPFPWYMYENELVEVIAGAAGIIIEKDDGFEDDHCECFGSWNAVYVQHADGSVAWYGHMKSGTLTGKGIGESVERGEYLGVVASSGCSTGPHLHLEVYDADIHLIDPFEGGCNSLNTDSWWESQPANRTPRINVLLTHDEVPEHGCPSINEDPHFQTNFYPGDVVYTAAYFHDAIAGTSTSCSLIDPTGEVWNSWTANHDVTYNASWWWWSWSLPLDGPFGEWTFQGDYNGEVISHSFNYGVYAKVDETNLAQISISPNPSNGSFQIRNYPKELPILIYNSLGEIAWQGNMDEDGFLNLSALSNGIYFLKIADESNQMTTKIIINKQ